MKKNVNKYHEIMARPDGRRPKFLKELTSDPVMKEFGEAMVMHILLLDEDGGTLETKWKAKTADEMAAREARKKK